MRIFGENIWWKYLVRVTPCEGEFVEVAQDLIVQARTQLKGRLSLIIMMITLFGLKGGLRLIIMMITTIVCPFGLERCSDFNQLDWKDILLLARPSSTGTIG